MASAQAHVVRERQDVFSMKQGQIIVCDAISPDMTFVVPLATGIVERRGGMLIHGAIIAREYGIPCVTGIPDATELIHTGDWVTIDGHLGIVTVNPMSDQPGPQQVESSD
jgi:pyruvate,water dikinase